MGDAAGLSVEDLIECTPGLITDPTDPNVFVQISRAGLETASQDDLADIQIGVLLDFLEYEEDVDLSACREKAAELSGMARTNTLAALPALTSSTVNDNIPEAVKSEVENGCSAELDGADLIFTLTTAFLSQLQNAKADANVASGIYLNLAGLKSDSTKGYDQLKLDLTLPEKTLTVKAETNVRDAVLQSQGFRLKVSIEDPNHSADKAYTLTVSNSDLKESAKSHDGLTKEFLFAKKDLVLNDDSPFTGTLSLTIEGCQESTCDSVTKTVEVSAASGCDVTLSNDEMEISEKESLSYAYLNFDNECGYRWSVSSIENYHLNGATCTPYSDCTDINVAALPSTGVDP